MTTEQRFWEKVGVGGPSDCWDWKRGKDKDGYGRLGFDGKIQGAHRVAFFLTHERWPEPCCLHTCDNPACVNPAHLFEGTQKDNVEDMVAKGRAQRCGVSGEQHGRTKLTQGRVEWIRIRARGCGNSGLPQSEVARMLGVSQSQVNKIVNGKSWKGVV